MGRTEDFERRMRRQFHDPRWSGGLVVSAWMFLGASCHMLVRKRGLWELLLSVIVLWVTYLGSVLLHELGHALVARAVGLHPIVLVSGTGPRLRARVAGIALNLGLVPAGGLVRVVSETAQRKLKWRLFAVYAAGPTVSLAEGGKRDGLGLRATLARTAGTRCRGNTARQTQCQSQRCHAATMNQRASRNRRHR